MNWTILFSLLPFAFVMSITPGPNNLMVAASGVNFGFWRTMPHMLGVTIGFPIMLICIGLGLGAVIGQSIALQMAIKYLGCGYLIYTAIQLALSTSAKDIVAPAHPKTFVEAAAFQWINPKAWMMGVSSMATYSVAGANKSLQTIGMSLLWGLMAMVAVILWTLFGALIAERLQNPRALRMFNISMAAALIASLAPVLFH
jgi:threonine/homoserine/homoserine lactone efflux protein